MSIRRKYLWYAEGNRVLSNHRTMVICYGDDAEANAQAIAEWYNARRAG